MSDLQNPHLDGRPFFLKGGPRGVLLIHGLTATAAEVRPLAEFLHRLGYTVAGPLLPGHGAHPADLNRVRWQDWAAGVEEVYRHLKQECAEVVAGGESTGAVLALNLALAHPEVAALLLYAPALKLQLTGFDVLRMRLAAPFIPWLKKPYSDSDMPWQGYFVNPLKGVLQLLALQKSVGRRLAQIAQPALIVQGRLDASVDPGVPEALAAALGSQVIELHWMEKSTHCVLLDVEMEQVHALTQDFLSRVWKTR